MLLKTKTNRNLDGSADTYRITSPFYDGRPFYLTGPGVVAKSFQNLDKLFHTLGGIVEWGGWSAEAQEYIAANNGRGSF